MGSASWGAFEWGAAEWGSGSSADAPWSANISMSMTMVGSLQLAADLVANIGMTMTVVGGLTALIQMAADIPMVMNMEAALRVARRAHRLEDCGDPLSTTCQDGWMPGA